MRLLTRPLAACLKNVGPSWFTAVMGTGILAIGIAAAPAPPPHRDDLATAFWLLDVLMFVAFSALWLVRTLRRPGQTFSTLNSPVTAQAWGAPPMAAFTVAVGFLVIGRHVIGSAIAVPVAQWLFVAGVAGSIASVFVVPFLLFTSHDVTLEHAAGSWLLPVVPPIVASVPAALLSPFWPQPLRANMLALAYALLGTGLLLAFLVIGLFYVRLTLHKVPRSPLVPTMWIVVGPLGQSIAGFLALGDAARSVWPAYGGAFALGAVAYGTVMWGFAMYWLTMAIAVTLRAVRTGIQFSIGWWAFTFPVGVLTAGTVALYHTTHATVYEIAATVLLGLLAMLWALVASHTVHSILTASEDPLMPLEPAPRAVAARFPNKAAGLRALDALHAAGFKEPRLGVTDASTGEGTFSLVASAQGGCWAEKFWRRIFRGWDDTLYSESTDHGVGNKASHQLLFDLPEGQSVVVIAGWTGDAHLAASVIEAAGGELVAA